MEMTIGKPPRGYLTIEIPKTFSRISLVAPLVRWIHLSTESRACCFIELGEVTRGLSHHLRLAKCWATFCNLDRLEMPASSEQDLSLRDLYALSQALVVGMNPDRSRACRHHVLSEILEVRCGGRKEQFGAFWWIGAENGSSSDGSE
jgi:hypothetical protein